MRFDSGVDDKTSSAAPVFMIGELPDALNVGRWIAAREDNPQKIVKRRRRELAVINQHDQWKSLDRFGGKALAELSRHRISSFPSRSVKLWALDCQNAGQADFGFAKSIR